MAKISMNKVTKAAIIEMLETREVNVDIPDTVVITGYSTGELEAGADGNKKPWLRFDAVSAKELDLLKQVGLEDNANSIKVKIANYAGPYVGDEDSRLNKFVGHKFSTEDMALTLQEKKSRFGSDITGVAFRTTLESLREVK